MIAEATNSRKVFMVVLFVEDSDCLAVFPQFSVDRLDSTGNLLYDTLLITV